MISHPPIAGRRFNPDALLFGVTPLLFAGNMLVARMIAGDVPPVTLACLRWSIAALALLPFVRSWRAHLGRIVSPAFALLVLTGAVLAVAPIYAAAARTGAGNIALLVCAAPAFVLVAECLLFGARLGAPAACGVALAACGVVTVVTHGAPGALLALPVGGGDALAFAAMLAWVCYTLLAKHRPVALPPMVGLAALATGGALMLLPAAAVELARQAARPHLGLVLTPASLAAVVFLGLVPSIGGYGSYGRLVRAFGPARAALSMYLVPVYAVLLAAMLLGEALHRYHAVGLALILGGVSLSSWGARARGGAAGGRAGRLPHAAAAPDRPVPTVS